MMRPGAQNFTPCYVCFYMQSSPLTNKVSCTNNLFSTLLIQHVCIHVSNVMFNSSYIINRVSRVDDRFRLKRV